MKRQKLVKVTIEKAAQFLLADDTYRKHIYLIQNKRTLNRYYTTGKENGMPVCCVYRAQCRPLTLKADGFKAAFIRVKDL